MRESSRLSHPTIWFQLANVWLPSLEWILCNAVVASDVGRALRKILVTDQDLSALPRYAAPSAVLCRSVSCGFAEAHRISQALVTAHITDTSRRSPSGVMLRASQSRPRYAGRPTIG